MAGTKRKGAGGGPSPAATKKRTKPSTKTVAPSASSSSSPCKSAIPAPSSSAPKLDPQEALLSTSTSLFEYLERLSPRTLRSIYALPSPRGPTVAAAVLRSSCITDMGRQVALRLVSCGGKFKVGTLVEGWIHRHGRRDAFLALRRLESMGILEPTLGLATRPGEENSNSTAAEDDDDGDAGDKRARLMGKDAVLTQEFCLAMKLYLSTSSSSPWPMISQDQLLAYKKAEAESKVEPEKPSRDPPTRAELDVYTQSSWDSVLHFLVGSDDGHDGNIDEPSDAMVQFLKRIELMRPDPDYKGPNPSKNGLQITSKGYEFMLRDNNAQVWLFVLQYLNTMAHHHEMKDAFRIEALSFLICLGSCRVGEGYFSSQNLPSKSARQVMKDFGRFGLLFVCRVAGKIAFYPTKVAVNLVAASEKAGRVKTTDLGQSVAATRSLEDALSAPVPSRSHLAVVVQTNFQVVAYTRSKLHVATLGLFCDIQSYRRLPNVIFFHLTRDSIRSAFRLGVTADQILRFLHVHAHPMLRREGQRLVPANVSDQILLWDRERRRVVMDEVWVHQCRDAAEFAAVGQYASDADALAWGAAHTNKLYIHWSKHMAIQTYIRKWRTKQLRS